MHITHFRGSRFCWLAVVALLQLNSGIAEADTISQQQLLQRLDTANAPLVLDVRTPKEFGEGHVPGAVNIPHTELAARLAEVRSGGKDQVVVYCESGRRAGMAEAILRQAGFNNVLHLEGDMAAWRKQRLPQQ